MTTTHTNDIFYKIALTQVEGVGGILFRQLLAQFGTAEEVFKAKTDKLMRVQGIGKGIVEGFRKRETYFSVAEKTLETAQKLGVQLLSYQEENYPKRLKSLYDCPPIIYYKGTFDLNHPRTVGIVGTRLATDEGKEITRKIVEKLAQNNVAIISGLAFGIDIESHRAALDFHTPTVGVLANGVDIVYPDAHKKYIPEITINGGILSEIPFGIKPIRSSFLARNRIIAGLSDAVVVVESAQKGGSLVTAEYANNYHREVFAVPGRLGSKYSEGTNQLIKNNKAHIFTSTDDIIELMNWDLDISHNKFPEVDKEIDWSVFTEDESKVIAFLKEKGEVQIDTLSWETSVPLNKLASLLLNLEFQDLVKALPGKKFKLR